jgi:hypothetical protein
VWWEAACWSQAGQRHWGKPCRCVDEVDGVDAVAATALGVIEDVVEDGHAAEVVIFADLVGLLAELGDGEAGDRSGRAWILLGLSLAGKVDKLRTCAEHDAIGLRICTVCRHCPQ